MISILTQKEIVSNYLDDIYCITKSNRMMPTINNLASKIVNSGELESLVCLKSHCDYINLYLFSSIHKGLLNGIKFDCPQVNKQSITIEEDLLEELMELIKFNTYELIGLYYDKNGSIHLNKNKCITYLNSIMDIAIIDSILSIYNHKSGIWEALDVQLFGTIFKYLLDVISENSWKIHYEKEIYEGLERTVHRVRKSSQDNLLIPVENGVYDLMNEVLLPHSKGYYFTRKSPIKFDKDAKAPIFTKMIQEVTCNDYELNLCLQEMSGYTLIPNAKADKAFYLTGIGSNGKSLFAEILTEIVGRKNTVNIPLSKFSDRFGLETIVNKSLNIANENEVGDPISTENLKTLASGDTINISRKHKDAIDYQSTIKLIFLLNTLPDTTDNTHGYYRKILILPFNRVFSEVEADRELKNKIISSELSGVLNWVLEGAKRLVVQGYKFTKGEAVDNIIKEYKDDQNPVDTFYQEMMVFRGGESTHKKEVLHAYREYLYRAGKASRGTDSPQRFWKLLKNSAKMHTGTELGFKKVQGYDKLKDYIIEDYI